MPWEIHFIEIKKNSLLGNCMLCFSLMWRQTFSSSCYCRIACMSCIARNDKFSEGKDARERVMPLFNEPQVKNQGSIWTCQVFRVSCTIREF